MTLPSPTNCLFLWTRQTLFTRRNGNLRAYTRTAGESHQLISLAVPGINDAPMAMPTPLRKSRRLMSTSIPSCLSFLLIAISIQLRHLFRAGTEVPAIPVDHSFQSILDVAGFGQAVVFARIYDELRRHIQAS